MLKVKPSVPVKFKRRSVSAVRNFPKGCRIPAAPKADSKAKSADVTPGVVVVPEVVDAKESNGLVSEYETKQVVEKAVVIEGPELLTENGSTSVPESVVGGPGEQFYSKRRVPPKRRKVFALRHFPRGCGRNARKIESKGVSVSSESKTGVTKVAVNDYEVTKRREVQGGDGAASASPKQKSVDEETKSMGMEVAEPSRGRKFQESCGEPKIKFPKPKSLDGEPSSGLPKLKSFDGEVTVKSPNFENFDGEAMVMSPKRKNLEGEALVKPPELKNSEKEAMIKSSKPNNLEGEAMFMSSESKNLEGEAMVMSSEPKNLKGEAMVKSLKPKNLDRKDTVKLPKPMIFDGEASPKSPNLKNSYGEVMAKTPKLKNLDREARVKSPKPKSPKLKNLEGETMIKSSKFKNLDGDAKVKSPRSNSLDAEKIPEAKLQIVKEGGIRGSSAEMKVKTSDCKQIKEKEGEISNKAQVGSPSSSSLSENNTEENHEKKILTRSTSENKMEGSDVKLVLQNHRVQQESGDFRLSSGNTGVDIGGRSLTGKHVGKLSIKGPKNGIRLKRKFAEEVDDKSLVSQDEESVEAYGDRLVVQALMSAENCPWRKGRKSATTGSRSATPKFKTKDKQKLLNGTLPSRGLTIFQHKNEMDLEDEEDLVPQDDDNEKALVLYKQPQEFSITLPPCVPPKANHDGSSSEGASARAMVKRTLRLFQWITRKFLQEEEARSRDYGKTQRADLKAASILKESNNWVNYGTPTLGDVPGVEVGDEFHYRVELSIIGVHRPFQGGIDFMRSDGVILATSIVASGGYAEDNTDSSDILIYSGSGGTAVRKDKQAGDQKLERGNLALKNSIDSQTPVRVVRGFKEQFKGSDSHGTKMVSTFTYDGLYIVEKYWQEKGPHGFSVFKFQLRRMLGQPEIALKIVKKTKKSKIREGLITKDISNGKETIPICAINTVDNEQPMAFKYITQVIYPSSYHKKPPRGCDCINECADSEKCSCAVKNGGEIPFNYNGAIVQAKTLVYECGPSCKCPSSCPNRVSQHGIKVPLEIFKTEKRGWGVRSLYSIPSGSFICEYIGEMLEDTDAEKRSNDEYLFDIGHNYDDHTLWEGLPNPITGLQSNAVCETVEDGGFTIDAAEYGNVGRFINHSCSPNLYAQNVLYDHDDRRTPHIMFFAADNIPPLQELTYHYNYCLDQVRDEQGNIKIKYCFCGSPECTGRLY